MEGTDKKGLERDVFAMEKEQLEEMKAKPEFEELVKKLLSDYVFLQKGGEEEFVSETDKKIEELLQRNIDALERAKQEEKNHQIISKLEESIQKNMTIEHRQEYIGSLQERGQYFQSQIDKIQGIEQISPNMIEDFEQLKLSLGREVLFYVEKIKEQFSKLGVWDWRASDTVVEDILTAKHKVGDIVESESAIHINGQRISKSDLDAYIKTEVFLHIEDIKITSDAILKEMEEARGLSLSLTLDKLARYAERNAKSTLTNISTGIVGTGKITGYQKAMDNLIEGLDRDINEIELTIIDMVYSANEENLPYNKLDIEKLVEKLMIYNIQFQDKDFQNSIDEAIRSSLFDTVGGYDIRNQKEVERFKTHFNFGDGGYFLRNL